MKFKLCAVILMVVFALFSGCVGKSEEQDKTYPIIDAKMELIQEGSFTSGECLVIYYIDNNKQIREMVPFCNNWLVRTYISNENKVIEKPNGNYEVYLTEEYFKRSISSKGNYSKK